MSKYIKSIPASEAQLEKATLRVLRASGALCYKFASPAKRGVPDDIVLLKYGETVFVEFKNPNGRGVLSKLQEINIEKINSQGFKVFVVGSLKQADDFIDYCLLDN